MIHLYSIISGCILGLLLIGCSAVLAPPDYISSSEPNAGRPEVSSLSAVQNLYARSTSDYSNGDFNLAESNLERALRIEPENPFLWFTLAQCAYAKGEPSRARELALKADSLAGHRIALKKQIRQIIGAAE